MPEPVILRTFEAVEALNPLTVLMDRNGRLFNAGSAMNMRIHDDHLLPAAIILTAEHADTLRADLMENTP